MKLVDSHCHLDRLDLSKHDNSLEAALQQARDAGIEEMLCVGIDMEAMEPMLALVEAHEGVYASVGVHPNEHEGHDPSIEELIELSKRPKVIAIGETGLDYFRSEGDLTWQRDRFRRHIEAAKQVNKPLIIHTRESSADTLQILEEEGADAVGGVMHCFVEDMETAQRALDIGFYISFSGIVTFKNAKELKEVAKQVPLERMLVETDSPYLAPVPHRGKPNQPAYTRHVAETIAELREIPLEQLAEATTDNFHKLFKFS